MLPINARALLRMVQRWSRGKYTPVEVTLFRDLETHVDDIKAGGTSQWERISLSAKAVKAYSKCGIEEEGVEAFGAKVCLPFVLFYPILPYPVLSYITHGHRVHCFQLFPPITHPTTTQPQYMNDTNDKSSTSTPST